MSGPTNWRDLSGVEDDDAYAFATNGGCPSRVGDRAAWCDTHGGVTAVCTACDARALIVSWTNPVGGWAGGLKNDGWLIGAHQVFDPVALRDALAGVS